MGVVSLQVDWTQTYEIPAAFTALASEVQSAQPQVQSALLCTSSPLTSYNHVYMYIHGHDLMHCVKKYLPGLVCMIVYFISHPHPYTCSSCGVTVLL